MSSSQFVGRSLAGLGLAALGALFPLKQIFNASKHEDGQLPVW